MATSGTGRPELFLHVPFAKRWEYHKATIHDLYIGKGRSIEEVAAVMKKDYSFDANIRPFKHHLKKWNFAKAVPKSAKANAVRAVRKRLQDGRNVTGVRYKGWNIDKGRIRRYLRDESRLEQDWRLINVVFGTWNLPYGALKASLTFQEHTSPFGGDWSTPSEISFLSPNTPAGGPSPGHVQSPANAQTPTTIAIRAKANEDRARFLVQGKADELLKDLSRKEKRVAATWLYELWFFAFTTSKNWGRGPRYWTPDLLRFRHFQDILTAPNTPAAMTDIDMIDLGPRDEDASEPSSLCSWSIHCRLPSYEGNRSPSPEEDDDFEFGGDPRRWPRWSTIPESSEFKKLFHDALRQSSFSTLETCDVPLATSKVATAVWNSPEMLQVESIGFAIIARNFELLQDLLEEEDHSELNLSSLYPYHLAANYLDGAETCCGVLDLLVCGLNEPNLISRLYVNDYGHTVLDSLMITILKSHSTCTPAVVDECFKITRRFSAEDVDPCGRWDADSFCVRKNNARASPNIPRTWKHAFCHTSAQAVCHAAIVVFGRSYSPDINTPSGIFAKSCSKCSQRLKLGPLHTLMITGFHLAQSGFEGESLFGILACLVCLLTLGADPTLRMEISVDELLDRSDGRVCHHRHLDPVELAEQVPDMVIATWADDVQVGWQTVLAVLRFSQRERNPGRTTLSRWGAQEAYFDFDRMAQIDDEEDQRHVFDHYERQNSESEEANDEDDVEGWCPHRRHNISNFYCGSKKLGTLWAAIQTEMLTYRRLEDGDAWLSKRFSMHTVRDGANSDKGFSDLTLVQMEVMNPWCVCGRFKNARISAIPNTWEACDDYVAHCLNDEKRGKFLDEYLSDAFVNLFLHSDLHSNLKSRISEEE
ncbi:hypothetical protein GGR57DRAFT_512123 [Xylariaceae sp. FL1272]|nr:hypothetical protein GGR57DRAFT_512123 [Xylariaceae sp. FL1272]